MMQKRQKSKILQSMKRLLCFYRFMQSLSLVGLLALQAEGQNINKPNIAAPAGLSVNSFTGNLYYQRTDLMVPGQGLPIDLTFSYNSFRDSVSQGYGRGWTFGYSMYYTVKGDTVVVERGNGRRDAFIRTSGNNFRSPVGIFDVLSRYETDKLLLTTKGGVKYFFEDASHRKLTKIQDANQNTLKLTYTSGVLTGIGNASNRSLSLAWQNGLLANVTEENSSPVRTVSFAYDTRKNLVSVTHPDGLSIHYAYDESGDLSKLIDKAGNEVTIDYNAARQVSSIASCAATQRISYNTAGRKTYLLREGAPSNQTTTYTYDENENLVKKEGSCCGFSNVYLYDEVRNPSEKTDGNGSVTHYKYDSKGNLVSVTDAAGKEVKFEYEPVFNGLSKITDKKKNTASFLYDGSGNLTDVLLPLGVTGKMTYDGKGNAVSVKDGNGVTTQFSYDAQDNLTKVTTPVGEETYAYDASGNIVSVVDPNKNKLELSYDGQNRLLSAKDALNNEVHYTYDGNGNIKTWKDPNSRVTTYGYDALDRLTKVQSPIGVTNYGYDGFGNLVSLQDANQHTANFQYNLKNLVETEKDALGNQTRYTYDNNGNVLSRTDANGKVTTYKYDVLNRLVEKSYNGNTDAYSYDDNGNLVGCKNNAIEMKLTYDALNRLSSKTVVNWNKTVSYTYDKNSNRETMTDPDGGVTKYQYDADNRLVQLTTPANKVIKFAYDSAGRLKRQENFNGTYANYDYDAANRLASLVHYNAGGEEIAAYRYTYDKNGNRVAMADKQGTHAYTYDEADRVKDVTYANGTTEKYNFDPTGNRTTLIKNDDTTSYTYDAADRLQSAGKATYAFDNNGNLVKKTAPQGVTTYEYDGENRLTKVTLPTGGIVTYQYDPLGNRIAKQNGNEQTKFFLDGDNVLLELDGSGSTEARYTAGLGSDNWLSMERSGVIYLYHQDGSGSITAITSQNGGIAGTYQYDIYGNLQQQSGSVVNPYMYTGREYDADIQLYYYRSRYYDAESGRFVAKDHFFGFPENPLSLNKYMYAESNPVNNSDPGGFSVSDLLSWIHTHRNLFNRVAKGRLTKIEQKWYEFGPPKYVDENGCVWELQSRFKSMFHEQSPLKSLIFGDGENVKLLRSNGMGGSYETIRVLLDGETRGSDVFNGPNLKGTEYGPSFNFSDNPILHSLLDILPHFMSSDYTPYHEVSDNCNGGDGDEDDDDKDKDKDPNNPPTIDIPIVRSSDPNDINGPSGYSAVKWMAKSSSLPYTIRFENDPDFATGAAQNVIVKLPIDENIDVQSLRLSDFGFGKYRFTVPANSTYYSNRLNVADSLGVVVDVLAGIDATKKEAFWIFESKDPVTGLQPQNAQLGFLPINDSTVGNGEGFVSFTLKPNEKATTGDSLRAKASIVFDINEPIPTNRWVNIVDAVAPASHLTGLPAYVDSVFTLTWTGRDDSLGSGVKSYDVFVSKNGGPFALYKEKLDSTSVGFTGETGATYSFYTVATDNTGNREPAKIKGDLTVAVAGTGPVVAVKAFLQGPYNTASGMMSDSLRSKSLLPFDNPYPALGFTPVGNTIVSARLAANVLDSTGAKGITDWIWLELRNSANPAQVVATRSALLRRDGSVVDMDGNSPVLFGGVKEGSYYVALRHRNHLGVMTATALALNNSIATSIDFTSPSTAAYGTDARNNQGGVMLLWAGDVNGDGQVRYNGAGNDKNAVLQKVGLTTSNNILAEYSRADVNLDGRVKYNGAGNDKNVILGVVGLSSPNKIITQQLPK